MKLFRYETPVFDRIVNGVRIQVIDRGEQRELRFGNRITQSARSLAAPDVLLLDYTRAMMAGLLFLPKPARVLHIGLGGGSLPRYLHHHLPDVQQCVVEVNPGVVEVAYRYFELPVSPRLEVVQQDGADFLRVDTRVFSLIFLDAFHADGATPHMHTVTIFRMLKERLERGGWLVVNTWGSNPESLQTVRAGLGQLFERLYYLSVRAESNVIFIAGHKDAEPSPTTLQRRALWLSETFPLDFAALLPRLRPAFSAPGPAPAVGATGP